MKEKESIKLAMDYEISKRRKPNDVHLKKLGYDIESSGRLIEVKYRDFPKRRFVFVTTHEFETFTKNKNAWLYIVTPNKKIIEVDRDKVLLGSKPKPHWEISLRKEIAGC
ncbi:MAG: DUF3883 domain-containing protein [Candidatus Micrarchaeales archaeon]|jgi:hypothetical protein|nr:DUF3883 domain-containing protein [Candidatus Micrarchaeales archaeon]